MNVYGSRHCRPCGWSVYVVGNRLILYNTMSHHQVNPVAAEQSADQQSKKLNKHEQV